MSVEDAWKEAKIYGCSSVAGMKGARQFVSLQGSEAGMMKIRLETRSGEFVAHEYVTPMQIPPEVIVWGERFFARESKADDPNMPLY